MRVMMLLVGLLAMAAEVSAAPLDKVVAVVNDDVITQSELNAQVEQVRQQLLATKRDIPEEKILRKQVLNHLIDVELQLQLAKRNDITVDGAELDGTLEKIAHDHHLSLTQLREEVTKQGLVWEDYRENIRKELLLSHIQQKAIGKDITVTAEQVDDYLKTTPQIDASQNLFHLQNIVIPLAEEPTTEQLKQARRKAQALLAKVKQGEDFGLLAIAESSGPYALEGGDLGERRLAELPEVFANQAVAMKVGDVVGPIRTGNGFQLIKLVSIKENKVHHEVQKTHVRHILLKPDANMTESEALRQARNIHQQLKSGKDFAVMAKQYSLDVASAIKGGDLGWVTDDELVLPFAEAMASLSVNAISEPIKTPFGWHIIQVLARKTEDDSEAFKRQQVRQLLQQRKFAEAVENWQQHVRVDAYVKVMDRALA